MAFVRIMTLMKNVTAMLDPKLAAHFIDLNIAPQMFAIPWIMTMFAQIFKLDKLFLVWDHVLQGDLYTPAFIAFAVLHRLREQLLNSDFSNCLMFLSDGPALLLIPELINSAAAARSDFPQDMLGFVPRSISDTWVPCRQLSEPTMKAADFLFVIDVRTTPFRVGHAPAARTDTALPLVAVLCSTDHEAFEVDCVPHMLLRRGVKGVLVLSVQHASFLADEFCWALRRKEDNRCMICDTALDMLEVLVECAQER
ncbi:hypothetical protein HDU82_008760 [Entophlyctis luteolus]|nr:hypothetical protein HDU82_008760 [Entophlyctis luteolus]